MKANSDSQDKMVDSSSHAQATVGGRPDPGDFNEGEDLSRLVQPSGAGASAGGEEIALEYPVTLEDMVALSAFHSRHSPQMRRSRRILQGIVVLIVAVTVVSFLSNIVSNSDQIQWSPATVVGLALPLLCPAALIFLAFAPAVRRWETRRAVRRAFPQGEANSTFGTHQLRLAPDGLTLKTNVAELVVAWPDVERLVVTKSHVFIYTGADQALVVPKSAFSQEENLQQFMQYVERYSQQAAS